jgi:amidophosphoribosyltransferase
MCGIVGVFNHPQASAMAYYALHALQHRGQEASGIVTIYTDEQKQRKRFGVHKGEGLVLDVFSPARPRSDTTGIRPQAATRWPTSSRFTSTMRWATLPWHITAT